MSKEIIDMLINKGYDAFISLGNIVVTKDGFTAQTPLDNALALMKPNTIETTKGTIKMKGFDLLVVVDLIIGHHKSSKDIKDGVYDDMEPISREVLKEQLVDIFLDEIKDVETRNLNKFVSPSVCIHSEIPSQCLTCKKI